jgi:hypothetical protein
MINISACKGNQGSVGPSGQVGIPCTSESIQNGIVISCPNSTPVTITDGINGLNGMDGLPGSPGTNGTIITVEQFCPGVDSSYPSTFPEVGLCINNNIYAVYSANDGFLTLITPGLYESNAVGSSCTFTVGDNCEITN